ncbi:hypothetical protein Tco_0007653 [Tanacetum coccineum]
MSLQEMENLKQHYLDERLSLSNDLQIKDYLNEKIDIRFRRECEDMIDELKSKFNRMNDDYEDNIIPFHENDSQIPPSIEITPVSSTIEPKDSLIMGDGHLSTIPKKESDEFIKSSVEDLVPILSESEDTSESDSDCNLPSCDDFSPINVYKEKSVTFSNPLFDSNDDFTSSDDESLSDEDVPKDNVKIYSKPLFEFDDEYISNIKDDFYDSEGDVLYLESLLSDDTTPNPPPEVFLDHDQRSLSDINDLKIMDKVFDPGIHENNFSPKYDCPDYEDSRARGFVHRSLDLQSLPCLYMGIRYPRSY